MFSDPGGEDFFYGAVKEQWFMELCHVATQTAVFRERKNGEVLKVSEPQYKIEKFYERVRTPSGWISGVFSSDRESFKEVLQSSSAGDKYAVWFTENVKIRVEEVDADGDTGRLVRKRSDLVEIARSVAELYGRRKLEFEVFQHPRWGIGRRPVKQSGLPQGMKDGDLLHVKFEADCEVHLAVFLVAHDAILELHPEFDRLLLDYGHNPGKSIEEANMTQFRFPSKGGVEVVVGEDPYLCVAITRDSGLPGFTRKELLNFSKTLDSMKSDFYGSGDVGQSAAFNLCSEGMVSKEGWRHDISMGLPPDVSFGELIVIRPANCLVAS